jgi:hypothetical protein
MGRIMQPQSTPATPKPLLALAPRHPLTQEVEAVGIDAAYEVGVVGIDPGVEDGDDHRRRAGGDVPRPHRVDVGPGGAPALAGVAQVPLGVEMSVVGDEAARSEAVALGVLDVPPAVEGIDPRLLAASGHGHPHDAGEGVGLQDPQAEGRQRRGKLRLTIGSGPDEDFSHHEPGLPAGVFGRRGEGEGRDQEKPDVARRYLSHGLFPTGRPAAPQRIHGDGLWPGAIAPHRPPAVNDKDPDPFSGGG